MHACIVEEAHVRALGICACVRSNANGCNVRGLGLVSYRGDIMLTVCWLRSERCAGAKLRRSAGQSPLNITRVLPHDPRCCTGTLV